MIGLAKRKVAVVPYDEEWPKLFDVERMTLLKTLGRAKLKPTIEHIGSTAVVGSPAKPIIDIVIGFKGAGEVELGLKILKAAGLDYVKEANQPGMLFMAKGSPRRFHYHLVAIYAPAWQKLILFRDYLRRYSGLSKEYGDLKKKLAHEFPSSRLEYTRSKKAFLVAVLNRAFREDRVRRHASAIKRDLLLERAARG